MLSLLFRVLAKTRHWPPSSSVSLTSDSTSSGPAAFRTRFSPWKLMARPKNTPSLSTVGRQSLTTSSAFSHFASAFALPIVADSASTWMPGLTFINLASVTSSVGPRLAESMRCTSSATTTVRLFIHETPLRSSESVFSEVATMMSFWPRYSSFASKSPVAMPTFTPPSLMSSFANSRKRSYFSDASAFSGTM